MQQQQRSGEEQNDPPPLIVRPTFSIPHRPPSSQQQRQQFRSARVEAEIRDRTYWQLVQSRSLHDYLTHPDDEQKVQTGEQETVLLTTITHAQGIQDLTEKRITYPCTHYEYLLLSLKSAIRTFREQCGVFPTQIVLHPQDYARYLSQSIVGSVCYTSFLGADLAIPVVGDGRVDLKTITCIHRVVSE